MSFTAPARYLGLRAPRRLFSTSPRSALAKMQIIGRLAAEPELTNTSTGQEIIKYTLATSYGPRDNQKTSWFRIASFEDGARRDLLLGLPKGTLIHVDADARMESWQDADGGKRTALNLVQRSLEILSRPRPKEEEPSEQTS